MVDAGPKPTYEEKLRVPPTAPAPAGGLIKVERIAECSPSQ